MTGRFWFFRSFLDFRKKWLATSRSLSLRWRDRYPCVEDRTTNTDFDGHYVYHLAWAARIIKALSPVCHVDIGSSLYFATMVSAFVPVDFFDYRPARLHLEGLTSSFADIGKLPFPDSSLMSLSCMHVVEHVGLGRYGDPLDPVADVAAMAELRRVLASGGSLVFVVPVGGEGVIRFNAHRIYTYQHIVQVFEGFDLLEFALVPDGFEQQGIIRHASSADAERQSYGCGCFWFRKKDGP